ncbi:MAG: type VI secretion protein IcmF/TssM N-terminal domain-containing protein [Planctomycetota bacterium]
MSLGSQLGNIGKMIVSPFLRIPAPYRIAGGAVVVLAVILIVSILMTGGSGATWGILVFLAVAAAIGLGIFLINRILAWRAGKRAASLGGALSQEHDREVAVSSEVRQQQLAEIKKRWEQAVTELKRANLSLYQLPWFLLIGEPQSGKSTTLMNSGLEFPVGADKLSGAGGTRNCDWWFTNHAVILDTAGRYAFNQSDAPDSAEWTEFLKLLRKHRPACPINGVILALPTTSLLGESREEREGKAKRLRQKLEELQGILGFQFPVFILVTKADRLLGFTEFFSLLPAMEQRQLFGWARPGEYSRPFEVEEFEQGFQELTQGLRRWRMKLIEEDMPAEQRDRLYVLPEEFETLQEPLRDTLSLIFKQNVFAEPLYLRGVFVTSGLQKGRPIVKACAQLVSGASHGPDEKDLGEIFEKSRTFFVRDFYRRKVFPEAGLVNPSSQSVQRQAVLSKLVYGLGGTVAAIVLVVSLFGFFGGTNQYEDLERGLQGLRDFENAGDDVTRRALLRARSMGNAIDGFENTGALDQMFRLLVGSDAEVLEGVERTYEDFVAEELIIPFLDDQMNGLVAGDLVRQDPLLYQKALASMLELFEATSRGSTDEASYSLESIFSYARQRPEKAGRIVWPTEGASEEMWGLGEAWKRAIEGDDIDAPLHESSRSKIASALDALLREHGDALQTHVLRDIWERVLSAHLDFDYAQLAELIPRSREGKDPSKLHEDHRVLHAAVYVDQGIQTIPANDASFSTELQIWSHWPSRDAIGGWTYDKAAGFLNRRPTGLPDPADIVSGWRNVWERYLDALVPDTGPEGTLASMRSDLAAKMQSRLDELARSLPPTNEIVAFCDSPSVATADVATRFAKIRTAIDPLAASLPRRELERDPVVKKPESTGLAAFDEVSQSMTSFVDSLMDAPEQEALTKLGNVDPVFRPLESAYATWSQFRSAAPAKLNREAIPIVTGLGLQTLATADVIWEAIVGDASNYTPQAVKTLRHRVAEWFRHLQAMEALAEGAQKRQLESIRLKLSEIVSLYGTDLQERWLQSIAATGSKLETITSATTWQAYRQAVSGELAATWLTETRAAAARVAGRVSDVKPASGWRTASPLDQRLAQLEALLASATTYLDGPVAESIRMWRDTVKFLDKTEQGAQGAIEPQIIAEIQQRKPLQVFQAFEVASPLVTELEGEATRLFHAPIQAAFQKGVPLIGDVANLAFDQEWAQLGRDNLRSINGYPMRAAVPGDKLITVPVLKRFLSPSDGSLRGLLFKYRGFYPTDFATELAEVLDPSGSAGFVKEPYVANAQLDRQRLSTERKRFVRSAVLLGRLFFGSEEGVRFQVQWYPKLVRANNLLWKLQWQGGDRYRKFKLSGLTIESEDGRLDVPYNERYFDYTVPVSWTVKESSPIELIVSESPVTDLPPAEKQVFESSNWALAELIYANNPRFDQGLVQIEITQEVDDSTWVFPLIFRDLPEIPPALPDLVDSGWLDS